VRLIEQVEEALRVGWQWEIRTAGTRSVVKLEKILSMKPVEIFQRLMTLAGGTSFLGRPRKLLQK